MTPLRDRDSSLTSTALLFQGSIPVAFGTSVAVSIVAFIGGFPALAMPAPLFLSLLLAVILAGGIVAERSLPGGILCAALGGTGAGLITLLILGGLFFEVAGGEAPSTPYFRALGFIALCTSVSAVGGAISRGGGRAVDDVHRFASVAAIATLVLVAIGGLVTSEEAGLAVPDWPTSFEANMFLLPLSRMVGGVFYEHAHRLFGALVGLTTISLAVFLWLADGRRSVRIIGAIVSVQVVIQGIIGGYRVTLAEYGETVGSLALRVFHGINAQFFLTLMVLLVVMTSRSWRELTPRADERAMTDRTIGNLALLAAIAQLLLGALVRHIDRMWVMPHILGAFLVVVGVIGCAVRATALHNDCAPLRRNGVALLIAVLLQLVLGFVSLAITSPVAARAESSGLLETLLVTAHQTLGALILAGIACHLAWILRLLPLAKAVRHRSPHAG